ncbi:MAG: hypothetical protein ACPIOQ_49775, partial [Promethearchaeia archaeon]
MPPKTTTSSRGPARDGACLPSADCLEACSQCQNTGSTHVSVAGQNTYEDSRAEPAAPPSEVH